MPTALCPLACTRPGFHARTCTSTGNDSVCTASTRVRTRARSRRSFYVLSGLLTSALAMALVAVTFTVPPAPVSAATTIVVSTAASLHDAVSEIKNAFEAIHPGIRVDLNLGSSGALSRQIEHGAPVDLFLSASEAPVQVLVARGLVRAGEVRVFATNTLVLVRSPYASAALRSWNDLLRSDVRRIAIGNPEHVPAGERGRAVFESLGMWEAIQSKLVFAEDVRQVLAYVETGAADAGIVYVTDAAASRRAEVIDKAPERSHAPIAYLAAPIAASRAADKARTFLRFLLSDEGQATLKRHGFGGLEE